MSKKIQIKGLSLASFLLFKGAKLLSASKYFEFESEFDRKYWELEFANSDFFKYDQAMLKLRYLQQELLDHKNSQN